MKVWWKYNKTENESTIEVKWKYDESTMKVKMKVQ